MENRDARSANGVDRDANSPRRRKMTMSDALKWAWGEELPKMQADAGFDKGMLGARSAWGSILQYGEVGSIVDRQPNRFGCIPFDMAGWPHADALLIADAVEGLAECAVDVPEGWHPMPELAAIDEPLAARAVSDALIKATTLDRDGALRFRAKPDVMVVRHAILGIVPDWRLYGTPAKQYEAWPGGRHRWFVRREVSTVVGTNPDGTDMVAGSTIEVDGWSSRLKRPVAGAYRKAHFVPDPVPVMVARGEYEIFSAAMCMLFDQLADRLETINLMPVDWPVQPWDDSTEIPADSRGPRILPDLAAERAAKGAAESEAIPKAKGKANRRAKAA